jgi:hypothetical protein
VAVVEKKQRPWTKPDPTPPPATPAVQTPSIFPRPRDRGPTRAARAPLVSKIGFWPMTSPRYSDFAAQVYQVLTSEPS